MSTPDPTKIEIGVFEDMLTARSACSRCGVEVRYAVDRDSKKPLEEYQNLIRWKFKSHMKFVHRRRCAGALIIQPTEKDFIDHGAALSKEYLEMRKADETKQEKLHAERMADIMDANKKMEILDKDGRPIATS